jgi:hypothetical protein
MSFSYSSLLDAVDEVEEEPSADVSAASEDAVVSAVSDATVSANAVLLPATTAAATNNAMMREYFLRIIRFYLLSFLSLFLVFTVAHTG